MFTLILLAQLVFPPLEFSKGGTETPKPYLSQPEFKQWFETAKIGDQWTWARSCNCNVCSSTITKASDTHVAEGGITTMTAMACVYVGELVKVK
jgi:hypothetical protein